ncbi:hypothetical protein ZHAS_00011214 [Anopheles sinensis]|uniref:Uncharacterized protein n=1 Tax=Anopheles sinensis TaxID=74873 RepID=A0A084VZM2_ANOSI|nr:hypothetical protein ZHAS_00011214 [Anopheles sinensis]
MAYGHVLQMAECCAAPLCQEPSESRKNRASMSPISCKVAQFCLRARFSNNCPKTCR